MAEEEPEQVVDVDSRGVKTRRGLVEKLCWHYRKSKCKSPLNRISNFIHASFEKSFYRLGFVIGKHPMKTVVLSMLIIGLACSGLSQFQMEMRPEKTWIVEEEEGQFRERDVFKRRYTDMASYWENSDREKAEAEKLREDAMIMDAVARVQVVIIVAEDNVFSPQFMRGFIKLDKAIRNFKTLLGQTYEDICILDEKKEDGSCYSKTLLNAVEDAQYFDESLLDDATEADILTGANYIYHDLTDEQKEQFSRMVGGIKRDNLGDLVSATAVTSLYKVRGRKRDGPENIQFLQPDQFKEENATAWEEGLQELILNPRRFEGIAEIHVFNRNVMNSDRKGSVVRDLFYGFGAGCLLFGYVVIMLGRWSCVETKFWLAVVGILSVFIGFAAGLGVAMVLGFYYQELLSALPVLIMAIGIDDMFVIVQSFYSLSEEEKRRSDEEQCALAMRNAGALITVTTLSDIAAFTVGCFMPFPSIVSFCICAILCLMGVFFLQITFFTACFMLDMKRVKKSLNGFLCCIPHKQGENGLQLVKRKVIDIVFKAYANLLTNHVAQAVIIVATISMFSVAMYGVCQLEVHYNVTTYYLRQDSDRYKFAEAEKRHYPQRFHGVPSLDKMSEGILPEYIYAAQEDYFAHQDALDNIYKSLQSNKYVIHNETFCWYGQFSKWLERGAYPMCDNDAKKYRKLFYNCLKLWGNFEPRAQTGMFANVKKDETGTVAASQICKFTFHYTDMTDVIDTTKEIVEENKDEIKSMFIQQSVPGSLYYYILKMCGQTFRNLALSVLVLWFCLLILTADLLTSVFVIICVIVSLVDVAGFMWYWGLQLETIMTLALILSVGLLVDYATHIGHSFLKYTGTRRVRMKLVLENIGPAVWHGGCSTLLAFLVLAGVDTIFVVIFFKCYLLVAIFGLFHGLAFLPVLLCLCGPSPYSIVSLPKITDAQENHYELNEKDEAPSKEPLNEKQNGTAQQSPNEEKEPDMQPLNATAV